jgi:hypothetical protein
VENAAFPAETHEAALDLLTMIAQDLQEQLDRAVLVDISNSTSPADLLDELETDVAAAAASAATASTQAGLAATAKTGAETAQGLAEDARDEAIAARDAIPAATDILLDSDIGSLVQGYDADTLISDVSKVRTKAHPSTKSAVTDNSLTPDLSTAEVFDWTPTGAATLNAPTIIGSGVWAIRYNYTSGPTLPKATYDGSAWVATGDILLVVGFGSADYELVWLNKA